jgi:hypothetical protein
MGSQGISNSGMTSRNKPISLNQTRSGSVQPGSVKGQNLI